VDNAKVDGSNGRNAEVDGASQRSRTPLAGIEVVKKPINERQSLNEFTSAALVGLIGCFRCRGFHRSALAEKDPR
jgi:hypothetical protein